MNILFIIDQFPKLSETFIINHITCLIDSGYDVRIVARKTKAEEKVHPMVKQYNLLKKTSYFDLPKNYIIRLMSAMKVIIKSRNSLELLCSLNPVKYGLGIFTLQSIFRWDHLPEERLDLIHCHYGTIAWNCLALKSKYNAPLVTSFHGPEFLKFNKLGRFFYWHLFSYGDAFIANSEYTRSLLKDMECPSNKIRNIPVFSFFNNSKAIIQNKYDETQPKILTVARLVETKGIQYCILAIKDLIGKGYNFRYKIVGDGPYRESLESLVSKLNLKHVINFTGWSNQKEVHRFYKESHIFILPSIKGKRNSMETQGLVIQEAQQCGLVVLGSNIGGIPEGLNYGKAGILFEPGDFTDLKIKLRWVLDNPKIARKIAQAGNEHFRRKYSKKNIINDLTSLYQDILQTSDL